MYFEKYRNKGGKNINIYNYGVWRRAECSRGNQGYEEELEGTLSCRGMGHIFLVCLSLTRFFFSLL